MTSYTYMSDGLGGHVGLSCSPGLGSAKRVTKNKTHILLFNILLVFLCKSYSFQEEELKIISEHDQKIPQSQTADNPAAPRGRAAQPSQDTRKTN